MTNWKITGIIATIVIILSIPLYTLKTKYIRSLSDSPPQYQVSTFVGSKKCMDCHKKEYDKWLNSHHDLAMDVANENTVFGDFDNAVFEYFGVMSRFYRKDSRFFVHTQGPDGKMGEFEIKYTFGVDPLQQYLVPFPGGRLQCLPIAWDVKAKKWYRLPHGTDDPKDWLYWTNAGQNWNGMCAECHSTNLKKNYDPDTDTYQTTWSDINVGCEACHGAGSRHLTWAEMPGMARPRTENYELVVKTSNINSRELVELCAPCHSRRAALGDYQHGDPDLLDSLLPSLLTSELYFADGQIKDEVYVYGSFTQSKMYHRDVRCNDCHDAHSAKRLKEGNELCLQCHRGDTYDTKAHHFHKKPDETGKPIRTAAGQILFDVGTGADCVGCHMPGRTYMGNDYRPDHAFRIPRPDLSAALGTPDACLRCHYNKTTKWSDGTITKWYGPARRPHYGSVIQAGRNRQPGAGKGLIRLAGDPLYPVIVRATALSLLSAVPGEDTARAMKSALMDDEALIRRTAVEIMSLPDPKENAALIAPLLYDPVKGVRIEAARRLAEFPTRQLNPDQEKVFPTVLKEFEDAMTYSADFSSGRHNLGNLYAATNRIEAAIKSYQAAIKIDGMFYPAKVNLAMIYNQRGENNKAEKLLREAVDAYPEMGEIAYSLGLLLVEMKKHEPAALYLHRAAKRLPGRARVYYNLGLLLQSLGRDGEAETALQKAHDIDKDHIDYLFALADFYLKRNRLKEARPLAEKMAAKYPEQAVGQRLLRWIDEKEQTE